MIQRAGSCVRVSTELASEPIRSPGAPGSAIVRKSPSITWVMPLAIRMVSSMSESGAAPRVPRPSNE